jgi:hypothetical protein
MPGVLPPPLAKLQPPQTKPMRSLSAELAARAFDFDSIEEGTHTGGRKQPSQAKTARAHAGPRKGRLPRQPSTKQHKTSSSSGSSRIIVPRRPLAKLPRNGGHGHPNAAASAIIAARARAAASARGARSRLGAAVTAAQGPVRSDGEGGSGISTTGDNDSFLANLSFSSGRSGGGGSADEYDSFSSADMSGASSTSVAAAVGASSPPISSGSSSGRDGVPSAPPTGLRYGYFALGCYWHAEAVFGGVEGVRATCAGFIDGVEVVRVAFTEEPAVAGHDGGSAGGGDGGEKEGGSATGRRAPASVGPMYAALLRAWGAAHEPGRRWANQKFASAVYAGCTQIRAATAEVGADQVRRLSAFTAAPDKDQLYNLRSKPATAKLLVAGLEPELLSRINHCVAFKKPYAHLLPGRSGGTGDNSSSDPTVVAWRQPPAPAPSSSSSQSALAITTTGAPDEGAAVAAAAHGSQARRTASAGSGAGGQDGQQQGSVIQPVKRKASPVAVSELMGTSGQHSSAINSSSRRLEPSGRALVGRPAACGGGGGGGEPCSQSHNNKSLRVEPQHQPPPPSPPTSAATTAGCDAAGGVCRAAATAQAAQPAPLSLCLPLSGGFCASYTGRQQLPRSAVLFDCAVHAMLDDVAVQSLLWDADSVANGLLRAMVDAEWCLLTTEDHAVGDDDQPGVAAAAVAAAGSGGGGGGGGSQQQQQQQAKRRAVRVRFCTYDLSTITAPREGRPGTQRPAEALILRLHILLQRRAALAQRVSAGAATSIVPLRRLAHALRTIAQQATSAPGMTWCVPHHPCAAQQL